MSDLKAAWENFSTDVSDYRPLNNLIVGKGNAYSVEELETRTRKITDEMQITLMESLANRPVDDISTETLCKMARYTDGLPLKDYENALDLVPALVNLVSLADALPLDGSSLPFNLRAIAMRCRGAVYFAPRRFTAVQLAFDEPRSRILLFRECKHHTPTPRQTRNTHTLQRNPESLFADTGRVVGTGCNNPTAAKLAVIRALKAISTEAHVHVAVRRFAVINQVCSLELFMHFALAPLMIACLLHRWAPSRSVLAWIATPWRIRTARRLTMTHKASWDWP